MLTRLPIPRPSHRPTRSTTLRAAWSPSAAARITATAGPRPRSRSDPRSASRASSPYLGLPTAAATAPASSAIGIDNHVADLACVAATATERTPSGHDSPTKAHFARQIDEVLASSRRAAGELSERSEVGVVAEHVRHLRAQPIRKRPPQGYVDPPQVWREPHEAIGGAYRAAHGRAHSDTRRPRRRIGQERRD